MAVTLILDSEKIYRRGGMANRWMHTLVNHFEANTEAVAPIRSGELVEGIYSTASQVGPAQIEGFIVSSAPHSIYVIDGTTGPIMSSERWASGGEDAYDVAFNDDGKLVRVGKPGFWLRLKPGGDYGTVYATEVRGQASNNFLMTAWSMTARQHSSIRGVAPVLFSH